MTDRIGNAVVVTGLGAVSAWGWSVRETWLGLLSAGTAIRPSRVLRRPPFEGVVVGEVPMRPEDARTARLSRADRFALAAADEAIRSAGLESRHLARAGLFFGGSTGGMAEGERFHEQLIGRARGRPRASSIASLDLNGPGDAVARRHALGGPVMCLASACASGTLAIQAGFDAVREGIVDVALVGGADALAETVVAGFSSLRALSPQPCRPFRARRLGLSLGEGAGVLVLESADTARARGSRPLALALGAGASCDAFHDTAPQPDGEGAARAVLAALQDAGLPAGAVDFVQTHGTGTPLNDPAEWHALVRCFGARATTLPLTSVKGSIGHALGAAGALEAVATVMCLLERRVHPSAGDGPVDPEIPARLVSNAPLDLPEARVALSTNLAFGGANAAILLGRAEGAP